jgi:hypothetical protein
MPHDNLPTQASTTSDVWNAPLNHFAAAYIKGKKVTEDNITNEEMDPWTASANNQPQEPYHLKDVGYFDINPTPPWKQPLKTFSVDETLLVHAKPEGYPALPDVQLSQLPGYLLRTKWTQVPANVVYWYSLKYRAGYNKAGVLGAGRGTTWPFVHYWVLVSMVGYWYHSMGT